MKKAVILLSGGLDSSTCLAYATNMGYTCYALSVNYGQKHCAELNASKNIATHFQVKQHEIITLPIGHFGGSALTDNSMPVEDHQADTSTQIPTTYVPARNTILLSIALGWAEILDADALFIGVSSVDYSGYPDCRPEYIQAFENMANLATKKGVEGHRLTVHTPLMYLSKTETIQLGISLGVHYTDTISCYRATQEGLACGICDSCHLRKKGFHDADIHDPTRYI